MKLTPVISIGEKFSGKTAGSEKVVPEVPE
jgi:hypothetical protein